MKKILTIIGARPQFIKASVLSRLIRSNNWNTIFQEVIVHTGQHYDYGMSDIFFEQMDIPKPDYNLNIGSGHHGYMTGNMLIEIEKLLLKEEPDVVIVYGDTNSTLAGALAASKLNIPIAHIEAGLRSYWKKMPEEQNRICTDHLSSLLFCPSQTAINNLYKENINNGFYNVGDIMYDSFLHYSKKIESKFEDIFEDIMNKNGLDKINKEGYNLLTIHRAENTDNMESLSQIINAIGSSDEYFIYPAHPRTIKKIEEYGLTINENIFVIDPVGYFEILTLQHYSNKIVTDSGGMQKEAYFAKKECITLREQTEWIETLNGGWNTLVGMNRSKIIDSIKEKRLLEPQKNYFGDGNSAELILKQIFEII